MAESVVLAEGLQHPEGPDLLPDGRIVFVETFLGRISAWSPERGVHVYAEVGGGPNACVRGADGLYVAQNGGTAGSWRSPNPTQPCIQRVDDAGNVEVVVGAADGDRLEAPNDLTFGPDGRLYFTDPGHYDPEHPTDGRLCVVEPDGTAAILEEVGPTYPNGIVAEADGSIVWDESYTRRVRRRHPDGSIDLLTTLPEGHIPDGLKLTTDGTLYITTVSSGGIDVVAPDGNRLGFVKTGGEPLNCVFDGSDLYVTDFGEVSHEAEGAETAAAGRLLRLRLDVSGSPPFRGAIASAMAP
jgi:gluconolactonase